MENRDRRIRVEPILFLDVDGVLNTKYTKSNIELDGRHVTAMDRELVGRLVRLLKESDCKIVLSSTWRIGGIDEGGAFFKAIKSASLANPDWYDLIKDRLIDKTEIRFSPRPRGYEIYSWVENWYEDNKDALLVFVIFDDMMPMTPFQKRLVRTNMDYGLQEDEVDKAVKMFGDHPKLCLPNWPRAFSSPYVDDECPVESEMSKLLEKYDGVHEK